MRHIRHGPALGGFFCTGLLHLANFFWGFAIRLTLSKHTEIVCAIALSNSTYTEECNCAHEIAYKRFRSWIIRLWRWQSERYWNNYKICDSINSWKMSIHDYCAANVSSVYMEECNWDVYITQRTSCSWLNTPVPTAIIVHRQNFSRISLVFEFSIFMLKVKYKIFLQYKLYTAIFLVVFPLHFSSSTDRKGFIQTTHWRRRWASKSAGATAKADTVMF